MIEEIFHSLDRPDEPLNIQVELRVAGPLHERALREALGAAVAAHPMTRARKVSRRVFLRPPEWEVDGPSADTDLRSIDCDNESALAAARAEFYSQPIDLARSPALRFLLAHRPGGDSLLLSANHTMTDGIGSLRFLHSVARAYSGQADPVPGVDAVAARDLQAQFGHTVSDRPRNAGRAKPRTGPRTLVAPKGAEREPGYGFLLSALSADQGRRLDPRRLVPAATVNDLLLASLHRTIAAWNANESRPCQTISILMPVNLRPPEWRHEVVGNLTLGGPTLSTPEQRSTAESLLAAMTTQTRRIKTGDDFAAFFEKPLWVRKLLLLLLLSRGTRSRDTAVLSNLGRIDDVPDFGAEAGEVTEFWFSPPVGMPTGLAIGAASLKGRLHLVIRYRRALFDERAARRFSDRFLNSLMELERLSFALRTADENKGLAPGPVRP
jgi:NRPS condensation-like uncharacterized protein